MLDVRGAQIFARTICKPPQRLNLQRNYSKLNAAPLLFPESRTPLARPTREMRKTTPDREIYSSYTLDRVALG